MRALSNKVVVVVVFVNNTLNKLSGVLQTSCTVR